MRYSVNSPTKVHKDSNDIDTLSMVSIICLTEFMVASARHSRKYSKVEAI